MPLPVLFDAKKRCEISFEYVGTNFIILPAFFAIVLKSKNRQGKVKNYTQNP
jgi:hypothetical protein